MAWEWSHTAEGIADAEMNLRELSKIGAIRELILFRDCAKKAITDPAGACAEFLTLAKRRLI